MTVTKIRTDVFKRLCEEARDAHALNQANGFDHMTFKDELEEALRGDFWRTSDEWVARAAPVAASYDELLSMLSVAAAARQQFSATRAQVEALARRGVAVQATMESMKVSTLTRAEASAWLATI